MDVGSKVFIVVDKSGKFAEAADQPISQVSAKYLLVKVKLPMNSDAGVNEDKD